ncbi:hypothetical protein [Amycolatopsis sp. NPDC004079]|uniref:hypothetical protein n=1 Tax=Amycolatopsis sp. NPDC004079 TaxID=3154549 RepID=UPI0033BC3771
MLTTFTGTPVTETADNTACTTWSAFYGGVTVQHRADNDRLTDRALPLHAIAAGPAFSSSR